MTLEERIGTDRQITPLTSVHTPASAMMVDVSTDQDGDMLAFVGICTYYVPPGCRAVANMFEVISARK